MRKRKLHPLQIEMFPPMNPLHPETAEIHSAVLALRAAGNRVYRIAEHQHSLNGSIVEDAELCAIAIKYGKFS